MTFPVPFMMRAGISPFRVVTGSAANTNSPSFSVDLGPTGLKQVFIAFGVYDTLGTDPWTFNAGTLDGDALTAIIGGGQEVAGNGAGLTSGATIRAIETTKGGTVSVAITPNGFSGTWNEIEMMAIIVTGYSTTAISTDNGDNEGASNGSDLTLNTTGARLVIAAAGSSAAPGNLQGPGSGEVTPVATTKVSLGYDTAPAGTSGNTYSFDGAGKYVIAGASFG